MVSFDTLPTVFSKKKSRAELLHTQQTRLNLQIEYTIY